MKLFEPTIFKELRELHASVKQQDHAVEARLRIPHSDYALGFISGFQSVAGIKRPVPPRPPMPRLPRDMTPFLMGVRKGVEVANRRLRKHT